MATGETKKGLFGGEKEVLKKEKIWEQVGWSDCEIDGERLNHDINTALEQLNQEGFELVAIVPIISRGYNYKYQVGGMSYFREKFRETVRSEGVNYGFGYGYSYTEGVSVIAKKTAC